MGRPSVYDEQIAEKICRRIAAGETLSEVCRSEGMPPRTTVIEWTLDNREGFADKYARARDMQIERWADELLSISDDGRNDWMERNGYEMPNGEHVQRAKLRSDNRKWLLSKLRPERYGDRVTHAGDAKNPVQVVSSIEMVPVKPEPRE